MTVNYYVESLVTYPGKHSGQFLGQLAWFLYRDIDVSLGHRAGSDLPAAARLCLQVIPQFVTFRPDVQLTSDAAQLQTDNLLDHVSISHPDNIDVERDTAFFSPLCPEQIRISDSGVNRSRTES